MLKMFFWLYYEGNDLYGLQFELKNEILNQYLANQNFKQDLKFKQTKIDQFLTTFLEREREREREKQTKFYISKIVKFIKLTYVRTLLFPPDLSFYSSPSPYAELKVILNLANELVSSQNGKLYFIYLPQIERYLKTIKMDHKQQIKNIVVDLDIEFIDIDEDVFQREKNPLKLFPFEKYAHYNVIGYKKVALKIYERTK